MPNSKKIQLDDDRQIKSATLRGIRNLSFRNTKKRLLGEPERAKNNYMHYCIENRPKVVKENPDVNAKEILVILGNIWNDMNICQRNKYDILAAKDKERYDIEMEIFRQHNNILDYKTTRKQKEKLKVMNLAKEAFSKRAMNLFRKEEK